METNPILEILRRELQIALNSTAAARTILEARHGRVWDPAELAIEFEVLEFAAPLAIVRRRADGKTGSLLFQHSPRY